MGFTFKVKMLPWVLLALGILMGGDPTEDLIGIAVGHFFFTIVEVPNAYGYHLLQTPVLNQPCQGTDYTATPGSAPLALALDSTMPGERADAGIRVNNV